MDLVHSPATSFGCPLGRGRLEVRSILHLKFADKLPMIVTAYRISSIWVEAIPEVCLTPTGKLGGLIDAADYADIFNELVEKDVSLPTSLPFIGLPWPRRAGAKYPRRNNYWDDAIVRKLRDHARGNIGKLAWKAIIPYRHKPKLAQIDLANHNSVEGWYYPHGTALTITISLTGNFDAAGLENTAAGLNSVPLPTGVESLDNLAERCMNALDQEGIRRKIWLPPKPY